MEKKNPDSKKQQKTWNISLPKLHEEQLNQITGGATSSNNLKQIGIAVHNYH